MTVKNETLLLSRYINTLNITSNKEYHKLFDKIDKMLVKQKFANTYEASVFENSIKIHRDTIDVSEINKIINNFVNAVKENKDIKNINFNEILQITNISCELLNKYSSSINFNILETYLYNVSHETTYISQDFLILKITDNLLHKNIIDLENKEIYKSIKTYVLKKMQYFNYLAEQKDREENFLCWIDRLILAVQNNEINSDEFYTIINRILNLITPTSLVYLKTINAVNYVLIIEKNPMLNEFKLQLEEIIKRKNDVFTETNIEHLIIKIFSQRDIETEHLIYLFTSLINIVKIFPESKPSCIAYFRYIVYYNKRCALFEDTDARKSFLENISSLVNKKDVLSIKLKTLNLIIESLHVEHFFVNHRKTILNTLLHSLKNINDGKTRLSQTNFYKYCDFIDFLIYSNPELKVGNIVEYLSFKKGDESRIAKHFQLSNSDILAAF